MPILGSLGATEWIIIGVVVFLLFGGKKMTELARGLGESGKELKRVKKEFNTAVDEENKEPEIKNETLNAKASAPAENSGEAKEEAAK